MRISHKASSGKTTITLDWAETKQLANGVGVSELIRLLNLAISKQVGIDPNGNAFM